MSDVTLLIVWCVFCLCCIPWIWKMGRERDRYYEAEEREMERFHRAWLDYIDATAERMPAAHPHPKEAAR